MSAEMEDLNQQINQLEAAVVREEAKNSDEESELRGAEVSVCRQFF